ncbi:hypothetical protein ACFU9X_03390 [Streptomyces atratus]|uniref:hypothetical protein n=1 Tax=Streptomyces atratus TaxID=1893 RepID=UPI003698A3D3
MKFRIMGRVSLVGIAALTAGVMASSPAAAISYGYGPWYNPTKGAKAYFEKHGDHIKICDIKTDGSKALVQVWDTKYDREQARLTDSFNDGKCSYSSAAKGGKYNLPENRWFEFLICIENKSGGGQCNSYNIYNDA